MFGGNREQRKGNMMSSAEQTVSLADVIGFVGSSATDSDLELITAAANQRHKHLGQVRAAAIKVGDRVELRGLSPKYLNGLKGTVLEAGKHYQVDLDADSVLRLRFGSGAKYLRTGPSGEPTLVVAPPTCLIPL